MATNCEGDRSNRAIYSIIAFLGWACVIFGGLLLLGGIASNVLMSNSASPYAFPFLAVMIYYGSPLIASGLILISFADLCKNQARTSEFTKEILHILKSRKLDLPQEMVAPASVTFSVVAPTADPVVASLPPEVVKPEIITNPSGDSPIVVENYKGKHIYEDKRGYYVDGRKFLSRQQAKLHIDDLSTP